jgi:hypothetical protein
MISCLFFAAQALAQADLAHAPKKLTLQVATVVLGDQCRIRLSN